MFRALRAAPSPLLVIFWVLLVTPLWSLGVGTPPWVAWAAGDKLGAAIKGAVYWGGPLLLCVTILARNFLFLPLLAIEALGLIFLSVSGFKSATLQQQILQGALLAGIGAMSLFLLNKDILYPFFARYPRWWRRAPRLYVNAKATLTIAGAEKLGEGLLQDCSMRGVGVAIDAAVFDKARKQLESGRKVQFTVELKNKRFEFQGAYKWSRVNEGTANVGFEVDDMPSLTEMVVLAADYAGRRTIVDRFNLRWASSGFRRAMLVVWGANLTAALAVPACGTDFDNKRGDGSNIEAKLALDEPTTGTDGLIGGVAPGGGAPATDDGTNGSTIKVDDPVDLADDAINFIRIHTGVTLSNARAGHLTWVTKDGRVLKNLWVTATASAPRLPNAETQWCIGPVPLSFRADIPSAPQEEVTDPLAFGGPYKWYEPAGTDPLTGHQYSSVLYQACRNELRLPSLGVWRSTIDTALNKYVVASEKFNLIPAIASGIGALFSVASVLDVFGSCPAAIASTATPAVAAITAFLEVHESNNVGHMAAQASIMSLSLAEWGVSLLKGLPVCATQMNSTCAAAAAPNLNPVAAAAARKACTTSTALFNIFVAGNIAAFVAMYSTTGMAIADIIDHVSGWEGRSYTVHNFHTPPLVLNREPHNMPNCHHSTFPESSYPNGSMAVDCL